MISLKRKHCSEYLAGTINNTVRKMVDSTKISFNNSILKKINGWSVELSTCFILKNNNRFSQFLGVYMKDLIKNGDREKCLR